MGYLAIDFSVLSPQILPLVRAEGKCFLTLSCHVRDIKDSHCEDILFLDSQVSVLILTLLASDFTKNSGGDFPL
jgi:hypothetical protein